MPGSTSASARGTASPIFVLNPGREITFRPGEKIDLRLTIPRLPLPRGRYFVWTGAFEGWTDGPELLAWQPVAHIDAYGMEMDAAPRAVVRLAPFHVESSWSVERR
jgi:hypothetical protein